MNELTEGCALEEASCEDEPVVGRSLEITFPESFFINPFAVSFPGDIPCPPTMDIAARAPDPEPVSRPVHASASGTSPGKPLTTGPVHSADTTPRISPTMPPAYSKISLTSQEGQIRGSTHHTSPPAKTTPSKVKQPTSKYGREIHFVDMRDKKEATRIRNTMNSRKHRQNKLDKIRELEKMLAASEAEKQQWKAKAKGPGEPTRINGTA